MNIANKTKFFLFSWFVIFFINPLFTLFFVAVLWAVVNNAGVLHIAAPLEWQTKEHFERTLNVNLYGAIMITKAFLPLLRESKGRLVNMSSVASMVAFPGVVAYNVSKSALEAYTDTFRYRIRGFSRFQFFQILWDKELGSIKVDKTHFTFSKNFKPYKIYKLKGEFFFSV